MQHSIYKHLIATNILLKGPASIKIANMQLISNENLSVAKSTRTTSDIYSLSIIVLV